MKGVKREIARQYPQMQSAHVSEAIAYGLGFRTHAALLPRLDLRHPVDPDYGYFDMQRFVRRAKELSGQQIHLYYLTLTNLAQYGAMATYTKETRRVDLTTTLRKRAWRNAMILAINAGIEQRQFTIKAGDNRWDAPMQEGHRGVGIYRFDTFGIPAIVAISDAGWDELSFNVALWPTREAEKRVVSMNAGLVAGELFATGWLERRKGAWLQVSSEVATGWSFACRRNRLRATAELEIYPAGYAGSGQFIL